MSTSTQKNIISLFALVFLMGGLWFFISKKDSKATKETSTSTTYQTTGVFTDTRDGETYNWISYNGIKWMTQNLRFNMKDSWCHESEVTCNKYGRLYPWKAAIKACPSGWHLPTLQEWKTLIHQFGGESRAFETLVQSQNIGFSALLGGVVNMAKNELNYFNQNGNYWTASLDGKKAWYYNFSKDLNKVYALKENKALAFSCRCVEEKKSSNAEAKPLVVANNNPENFSDDQRTIHGRIALENWNSELQEFEPMTILDGRTGVLAFDIVVGEEGEKITMKEFQSFETKTALHSNTPCRLTVRGSGHAYIFSLDETNAPYNLETHSGGTSVVSLKKKTAIQKDIKTGNPSQANEEPPSLNPTIVLLSQGSIDIENVFKRIKEQAFSYNIHKVLATAIEREQLSNKQDALSYSNDAVSYMLNKEETSIIPVIFYVKRK